MTNIEGNIPHNPETNLRIAEQGEVLQQRKIAMITGGTRGIGAEITRELALEGYIIIAPHRDPDKQERRANPLIKEVEQLGGEMYAPAVDLTDSEATDGFVADTIARYGQIDLLITNHAGGAEEWATDEYATLVNADSKVHLLRKTAEANKREAERTGEEPMPLTVIDIPSLWSLEYGHIEQLPDYERIARTKAQGMADLRAAANDLNSENNTIKLLMLCGHGIGDTLIMRRYKKMYPELMEQIEATASGGQFPVMTDMAKGATRLVTGDYPDGHIEYVGIPHWNSDRLSEEFYMYNDRMRRVDDMVFFGDEGFATYKVSDNYEANPFTKEAGAIEVLGLDLLNDGTNPLSATIGITITEEHTEGHLVQVDVLRGVEHTLLAIHGAKAALESKLQPGERFRVGKIEGASFKAPVVPGNRIRIVATQIDTKGDAASATVYREDLSQSDGLGAVVSEFQKITLVVEEDDGTPDDTLAITDAIENAAQAGGMLYNKNNNYPEVPLNSAPSQPRQRQLPLFAGFKSAEFTARNVKRGESVKTHARLTKSGRAGFRENAAFYVGNEQFGEVTDISCMILDEEKIVERIKEAHKFNHAS